MDDDAWEGELEEGLGALQSVSAASGLVVAGGGDKLYRIRPGRERSEMRDHPFGDVLHIAIEPNNRNQWAVVDPNHVVVFEASREGVYKHIDRRADGPEFLEIAWGKHEGRFEIYLLEDNSQVTILAREPGELPIEDVIRITNDRVGKIGLLVGGEEPRVFVSDNGTQWEFRIFEEEVDVYGSRIAIDGPFAALANHGALWVSQEIDAAFEPIEGIEGCVALAFGDAGTLYAATWNEKKSVITMIDAEGDTTPILELEAEVTSLVWDRTRSVLWSATSKGLLKSHPKSKARLLS
jgi:hypothetical protein